MTNSGFNISKILVTISHKKKVIENIGYLYILQILIYVFPLIIIPFLIEKIGITNYGLVAFAQSFIAYFILFTDFGYNLSSSKAISINRNNKLNVNHIVSTTLVGKLILVGISLLILLFVITNIKTFSKDIYLYIFTFTNVLGQALFPVWFFQGIEKMKFITIIQFSSRLVYFALLLIFIENKNDYYLVPLFNGITTIISSIVAIIIIIKVFYVKLKFPKLKEILDSYKSSYQVFLGVAGTSFYRNINVVLIGLITNDNKLVGLFSIAEKIIYSLQSLITPISQGLFPYISLKFSKMNLSHSILYLRKLSFYYTILLFLLSIIIILFSEVILNVFIKDVDAINPTIILCLKIMAIVPLLGGLNYLLGIIGLINLNYKKSFATFIYIAGIVAISTSLIFISRIGLIGASISVVIGEATLLTLIIYKLYKLDKKSAK